MSVGSSSTSQCLQVAGQPEIGISNSRKTKRTDLVISVPKDLYRLSFGPIFTQSPPSSPLSSDTDDSDTSDDEEPGDFDKHHITRCRTLFSPSRESSLDMTSVAPLAFSCEAVVRGDDSIENAAKIFHEELARIAPDTKFDVDCLVGMDDVDIFFAPERLFEGLCLGSLRSRAFSDAHPMVAPENIPSYDSESDEEEQVSEDDEEEMEEIPLPRTSRAIDFTIPLDRRLVAPFEQ